MSSPEDNERASSDPPDWDDEMAQQLHRLTDSEPPCDTDDLNRLYACMRSQCDASDKTLAGFLCTRATWLRRLLVIASFALIVFTAWQALPMVEESLRSRQWGITLAAYAVLLLVTAFLATRPVHRPPLAAWKAGAVAGATIAATLLAALWPSADAAAASTAAADAPPFMFLACMGMGLLLGVPVYALLRLFDQGNMFGNLTAAAAAGLAGNLLLSMHCPVQSGPHALLGHASVALIFVLGLGLVHRWIPSK